MFERAMEEWVAAMKAETLSRQEQTQSMMQLLSLIEGALAPELLANRAVLVGLARILRKLDADAMKQLEEEFSQMAADATLEKTTRYMARKASDIVTE